MSESDRLTKVGYWRIVTLGLIALAATGCKVAADGRNLQGARSYQSGNYDVAMQNFQKGGGHGSHECRRLLQHGLHDASDGHRSQ